MDIAVRRVTLFDSNVGVVQYTLFFSLSDVNQVQQLYLCVHSGATSGPRCGWIHTSTAVSLQRSSTWTIWTRNVRASCWVPSVRLDAAPAGICTATGRHSAHVTGTIS